MPSEAGLLLLSGPQVQPLLTPDVTEIGDLLAGREAMSRTGTDLTVFDMTGLALQDLTVARMLYRRAIDEGYGTRIPWPW